MEYVTTEFFNKFYETVIKSSGISSEVYNKKFTFFNGINDFIQENNSFPNTD